MASRLLLGLAGLFVLSARAQQQPWHDDFSVNAETAGSVSTGNFVFNALASLLQQLPNNLHPNGHTIVPAVIRAHTPLYHAFPAIREYPCSPEWLAFQPEMSMGIMGGLPMNVSLWTYVSNRELRVLDFDGMSAQLGSGGELDVQEVLLSRRGGVIGGKGWWDDYTRLKRLCEWAKDKGVDGFIRQNTAFELMWCDFDTGLDFVSRINVTAPDTQPLPLVNIPPMDDKGCFLTPPKELRVASTGADPKDDDPRQQYRRPPLTTATSYEWLRVGAQRYLEPQPGVRIIPSGLVSFYDPHFTSLVPARAGLPMSKHRVWQNISRSDATAVADQVETVLRRADLWSGGGVAWDSIARAVVEYWGDRLLQLNHTLSNPALNASTMVRNAQLFGYTILNPYLDTTGLPRANGSDPAAWLPQALRRCTGAHTDFFADATLTREERLLKASIETVQARLCGFAGRLFAEALDTPPAAGPSSTWAQDLKAVMDWLDWAVWTRCQPACDVDSLCVVPMWPILGHPRPGQEDPPSYPRCFSYEESVTRGWRVL